MKVYLDHSCQQPHSVCQKIEAWWFDFQIIKAIHTNTGTHLPLRIIISDIFCGFRHLWSVPDILISSLSCCMGYRVISIVNRVMYFQGFHACLKEWRQKYGKTLGWVCNTYWKPKVVMLSPYFVVTVVKTTSYAVPPVTTKRTAWRIFVFSVYVNIQYIR